jgi:hypothetical protein
VVPVDATHISVYQAREKRPGGRWCVERALAVFDKRGLANGRGAWHCIWQHGEAAMQFRMVPQQCAECGREVVGQGVAADGPSYHPHCSARRQAEALWRREVLASLGRIEAL